jgi:8-oxo-dGTP diphosphatase
MNIQSTLQVRLDQMKDQGPTAHSLSVAASIVDDLGRVLLVQRRDNHLWEPPGGVVELTETIEDGLHREVFEETGLFIESLGVSGVYKNMTTGVVCIAFRCRVRGGELTPSDETSAFIWAAPEQVGELTTPMFAARLLDAFLPNRPAVRAHDGHQLLPGRTRYS